MNEMMIVLFAVAAITAGVLHDRLRAARKALKDIRGCLGPKPPSCVTCEGCLAEWDYAYERAVDVVGDKDARWNRKRCPEERVRTLSPRRRVPDTFCEGCGAANVPQEHVTDEGMCAFTLLPAKKKIDSGPIAG